MLTPDFENASYLVHPQLDLPPCLTLPHWYLPGTWRLQIAGGVGRRAWTRLRFSGNFRLPKWKIILA